MHTLPFRAIRYTSFIRLHTPLWLNFGTYWQAVWFNIVTDGNAATDPKVAIYSVLVYG